MKVADLNRAKPAKKAGCPNRAPWSTWQTFLRLGSIEGRSVFNLRSMSRNKIIIKKSNFSTGQKVGLDAHMPRVS